MAELNTRLTRTRPAHESLPNGREPRAASMKLIMSDLEQASDTQASNDEFPHAHCEIGPDLLVDDVGWNAGAAGCHGRAAERRNAPPRVHPSGCDRRRPDQVRRHQGGTARSLDWARGLDPQCRGRATHRRRAARQAAEKQVVANAQSIVASMERFFRRR